MLQESGLFAAAAVVFRALYTLKLDSRRFGMDLGVTRKLFCFSVSERRLQYFAENCRVLGFFGPRKAQDALFLFVHDRL